ncbi:MAG: Fic family protein [Ruminococcus sp.]|jgi:Fic family protein|nr:Fic family protein [Ruminococcus sp.]
MDFSELQRLKEKFNAKKSALGSAWDSFERSFDIEYAHNSTAIEGNTLSLIETKAVLEDNLSIGGKSLREIYEVVNHKKAFSYVKNCVLEKQPLSEKTVKDIHAFLMENIMTGGIYRNVAVRITGAKHKPPVPSEMYTAIKGFYDRLPFKTELNSIELAAYTHAEFVKIHPFEDGNGRTARLIMNYQLLSDGFLPVSVAKEDRLPYFETLEEYAVNGNLSPFAELVANLEKERLTDIIAE